MTREQKYKELLERFLGCALSSGGNFTTGVCCCGSDVKNHGFWDGHYPVDSGEYWFSDFVKEVEKELKDSEE